MLLLLLIGGFKNGARRGIRTPTLFQAKDFLTTTVFTAATKLSVCGLDFLFTLRIDV